MAIWVTDLSAQHAEIKLNLNVYNKQHKLEKAICFVYKDGLFDGAYQTDVKGDVFLNVEVDRAYELVVSMPTYQTVFLEIDTRNVPPTFVRNLKIPLLLLSVRENSVSRSPDEFSIKWNPILEEFESFQINMGWKKELIERQNRIP